MDQTKRTRPDQGPDGPDEGQSASPAFPDDIEPLDEETLDAIAAVDRDADPELSAIIRAALALAEEEERQDEERRRRQVD